MPRFRFVCGCGIHNNRWYDWAVHFKLSGFKRGLRNLLFTKIRIRD